MDKKEADKRNCRESSRASDRTHRATKRNPALEANDILKSVSASSRTKRKMKYPEESSLGRSIPGDAPNEGTARNDRTGESGLL